MRTKQNPPFQFFVFCFKNAYLCEPSCIKQHLQDVQKVRLIAAFEDAASPEVLVLVGLPRGKFNTQCMKGKGT